MNAPQSNKASLGPMEMPRIKWPPVAFGKNQFWPKRKNGEEKRIEF